MYPSSKSPQETVVKRKAKLGSYQLLSYSSGPIRLFAASLARSLEPEATHWCEGNISCMSLPCGKLLCNLMFAKLLPKPFGSNAKTTVPSLLFF